MRGGEWCLGASPRSRNYRIPTGRVVPAFVRHGSTIVVSKCKSEESERKRRRERKGEEKRDRVREGEAEKRGDARLRWLRLIVFAASVLSFSQYRNT